MRVSRLFITARASGQNRISEKSKNVFLVMFVCLVIVGGLNRSPAGQSRNSEKSQMLFFVFVCFMCRKLPKRVFGDVRV